MGHLGAIKSPLTGPSVDGTDGQHKITALENVGLPEGPSSKPRSTASWALSPEHLVHIIVRFSLDPDHFRMKVLTIPNDRTADMLLLGLVSTRSRISWAACYDIVSGQAQDGSNLLLSNIPQTATAKSWKDSGRMWLLGTSGCSVSTTGTSVTCLTRGVPLIGSDQANPANNQALSGHPRGRTNVASNITSSSSRWGPTETYHHHVRRILVETSAISSVDQAS